MYTRTAETGGGGGGSMQEIPQCLHSPVSQYAILIYLHKQTNKFRFAALYLKPIKHTQPGYRFMEGNPF